MIYHYEQQIDHYKRNSKPIRTLTISCGLFGMFLKYKSCWFQEVNGTEYGYLLHGLCYKLGVYYYYNPHSETSPYSIVCNAKAFAYIKTCIEDNNEPHELLIEVNKLIKLFFSWSYDYIVVRSHKDETLSCNGSPKVPNVVEAKKWLVRGIKKDLTKETLTELVQTQGDPTAVSPLRVRCDHSTVIEKWPGCVYVDIHKAHASELYKVFKGHYLAEATRKMVTKGKKLKAKGDKVGYQRTKDIVNYAVGMLHMCKKDENGVRMNGVPDCFLFGVNTFPLYNRIVKDIFSKICDERDWLCGSDYTKCIYAQTDGLIVQHPVHEVQDSPAIGEFGLEFKGTVYTYHCLTIPGVCTGYTIYQYTEPDGTRVVKGDLPDELKKYIDLEKGQVVIYRKWFDDIKYIHTDLIEVIKEKIHENK